MISFQTRKLIYEFTQRRDDTLEAVVDYQDQIEQFINSGDDTKCEYFTYRVNMLVHHKAILSTLNDVLARLNSLS